MIIRTFLAWAETAPAAGRAQGASAIARAWLDATLSPEEHGEAETALTALLDDPAPSVRREIALAFAGEASAPHHIVAALANDQSDVSAPVLAHSPLLSDAELVEAARMGDVYAQSAIAMRLDLSAAVCEALAEHGAVDALIALAINETAALGAAAIARMLDRHAASGELREALLARSDLPVGARADLVAATASALQNFVAACGFMSVERSERACREAQEKGLIEIAADPAQEAAPLAMAKHLRARARLTPALLLRALVSGNRSLLTATLVELSGLPEKRVAGLVAAWSGAGFGALFARAGLPTNLLPAFRAALAAQDEFGLIYAQGQQPRLSSVLVDRALRACQATGAADLARVVALLRRMKAEAAREEARIASSELAAAGRALAAPTIDAPALDRSALDGSAGAPQEALAPEPVAVAPGLDGYAHAPSVEWPAGEETGFDAASLAALEAALAEETARLSLQQPAQSADAVIHFDDWFAGLERARAAHRAGDVRAA